MNRHEKLYVHRALDDEVTAIGGHYRFTKEERLAHEGRDVLYLCGYAVFDTTCCGGGGCSYAMVTGYVLGWKDETDPDGFPVSRVEPIRDPAVQKEIRSRIQEKESVGQVNFL
jgi:hypothetical protein